MRRILQIGNISAFILVLVVNYISNTGVINGETMASISARYENHFTPAGYAFSIWGLIYLSLLGFIIYQAWDLFSQQKGQNLVEKIGWWFILSCAANILWIFSWLNDFLGLSVILIFLLLFSLIKIILNTRMELDDEPLPVIAFVWWPFSFYSGWVTVAAIANVSAYLTSIGWNGFGFSEVAWTVLMIAVAGVINLVITWRRNMREFALVGVWALVAIAVANWEDSRTIVIASLVVAGILFISSSIHAYKNRETSPFKKL